MSEWHTWAQKTGVRTVPAPSFIERLHRARESLAAIEKRLDAAKRRMRHSDETNFHRAKARVNRLLDEEAAAYASYIAILETADPNYLPTLPSVS